ncbi:hypothetical protein I3843_11G049800 [Carya illinoinensis]|nr:hypothetical protein I3843_11G049800 [Carya illinoinensis]
MEVAQRRAGILTELPPGFRFMPTDQELVQHYLWKKELSIPVPGKVFQDIDARELYAKPPKSLVTFSREDREWYFFIYENEDSDDDVRTAKTRVVENGQGFWKSWQEEDDPIYDADGNVIAFKKNLTYFSCRSSKPKKTHWTMQEYRCNKGKGLKRKAGWVLSRMKRGREYTSCF